MNTDHGLLSVDSSIDDILSECDVETYSASKGKGGQNVNKRDTAVRLYHRPTGLKAQSSSYRTQRANKVAAVKRLRKAFKVQQEKENKTERVKTQVPSSVNEKRLEDKRRNKEKKLSRRRDWQG